MVIRARTWAIPRVREWGELNFPRQECGGENGDHGSAEVRASPSYQLSLDAARAECLPKVLLARTPPQPRRKSHHFMARIRRRGLDFLRN